MTRPEAKEQMDHLPEIIGPEDLLFSIGGGSLGNYWPVNEEIRQGLIRTFPDRNVVVLPQCVQYTDDVNGIVAREHARTVYQGEQVILACRGEESYEKAKTFFSCRTVLTPDLVLYSGSPAPAADRREGAVLCLRKDREKKLTEKDAQIVTETIRRLFEKVEERDMLADQVFTVSERKTILQEKYRELAGAEVVVTDRLHCMIFCAQTGTPCVVFENDHHKVRECYAWLRELPYIRLIQSADDLEQAVQETMAATDRVYPLEQMRARFAPLIEALPRG